MNIHTLISLLTSFLIEIHSISTPVMPGKPFIIHKTHVEKSIFITPPPADALVVVVPVKKQVLAATDCNRIQGKTENCFPTPTASLQIAKQIGEHTYAMQFIPDTHMATAQEIYRALNIFRQNNGENALIWDDNLGNYAQSRADFFAKSGRLDEHTGFNNFIHNQDGFRKLGYNHLGENAASAGPLSGTHIINNVFAGDSEHNNNQLDASWTAVGIGVNAISIDVVFGGSSR